MVTYIVEVVLMAVGTLVVAASTVTLSDGYPVGWRHSQRSQFCKINGTAVGGYIGKLSAAMLSTLTPSMVRLSKNLLPVDGYIVGGLTTAGLIPLPLLFQITISPKRGAVQRG